MVTEQITDTYAKIMAHEFNTGCGKKECDWCHFVKTNFKQAEVVLNAVSEEEEDI
jgi:DNA helicase-2/ATP-dependent DNA helicase PcrA